MPVFDSFSNWASKKKKNGRGELGIFVLVLGSYSVPEWIKVVFPKSVKSTNSGLASNSRISFLELSTKMVVPQNDHLSGKFMNSGSESKAD